MEIGDYRLEIIPDTEFRLDGGAMFGVVPRVLWERVAPPDERNRVRLNMNCAFVDTGKEKILIETGIGEKWSEKETAMYGIFRTKPFAETLFEKTGCTTDEITIVVNTHLHFDHAGGNTLNAEYGIRNAELKIRQRTRVQQTADATGTQAARMPEHGVRKSDADSTTSDRTSASRGPVPQFKNARYFVSKSELEHANNPHERDRASYLHDNWQPVADSGQLELKPDNYEVITGLNMQTIRGHSKTMQTWRLDQGGQTVYGFADLIPTRNHLALPWIMGYDLYPTETLEFKKKILPEAVQNDWLCLFYHDTVASVCRVVESGGKMVVLDAHA